MSRTLVFDKELRKEWADRLKSDIKDAQVARTPWMTNYRKSHNAYRNLLPPKDKPWPGCANLSPPVTTTKCEQLVRRLVMYYLQDPPVSVTANSAAIELTGRAKTVEDYLAWQYANELNYIQFVDAFCREAVIGGTAFGVTEWCYEERMVADLVMLGRDRITRERTNPPFYKPIGEPAQRKTPIKVIVDEMFGSQNFKVIGTRQTSKKGPLETYEVIYTDNGVRKKGTLRIDRDDKLGDEIEVVAEFPKVIKNQPLLRSFTADRVIVPPGDHDIQNAPWYGVLYYVPFEYIEAKVKAGKWNLDKDEMADLERTYTDKGEEKPRYPARGGKGYTEEEEGQAQSDQDLYVGVDSQKFRGTQVRVVKIVRPWPILKDPKQLPEAQIFMLMDHDMIARVHYDSIDNFSGMRNIVAHSHVRSRNEFYGISAPMILESTQMEINALHNMRADRESITGNPMIFADYTASFERDGRRYGPGDVVRVNAPGDNVMIPQWPQSSQDALVLEQQAVGYAEDLMAVTNESVGRQPDRPGAQRTFRGLKLLQGERDFSVFYQATGLSPHITQLAKQIHAFNCKLMPRGKEFRVLGTNDIKVLPSREFIRGEFDFKFEVGQATLNPEARRASFVEAFQLVASVSAAMPEQVPKPLYNLAKRILILHGEKAPEQYLPTPIEDFGPRLTPEQEHQIFLMGRPVPVHPLDIDQVHLSEHMLFAASENFAGMSAAAVAAFQQHILEHERRLQSAGTRGTGAQPGNTGVALSGQFGMGDNPMVNSAPGQPAKTQPLAPTGVGM